MGHYIFNPIHDGPFWGCSCMSGTPSLKSVTHILSNLTHISIFSPEILTFVISRNTDIDCILIHNFYFFKVFLSFNKHGSSFVDVDKIGHFRPYIKVFWNKSCDIIIFVHDVTNEILYDSNKLYCVCGHVTEVW